MRMVIAAVAAFLVGAVPTGFLVSRARGVDIRRVGSGNIGATNVVRALGWGWGVFTLAADILKGSLPVLLIPRWVESGSPGSGVAAAVLCAAAAVAGHNWTPFLGFRGGKGVATGAGALLALTPIPTLAAVLVWLLVFGASRFVSLASIGAAAALPVLVLLFEDQGRRVLLAGFTAVLAVVTLVKHRSNVVRLVRGEEPQIGARKS